MNTHFLFPEVIKLAKNAGQEILTIYQQKNPKIQVKADQTPLTEADLIANQIITEGLVKLTKWPILSEESVEIPFSERQQWQRYWLVDPLDGTKEFIQKTDEFTINIALVEKNQPILGVIYAPALQLCYFAGLNQGAFKQEKEQAAQQIRTRPYNAQDISVVASRRHGLSQLQTFLNKLGNHTIVQRGSALKCCVVAEAMADIYPRFGPTSEWDIAAGQCILEAAGGAIIDFAGNPLRYNLKESLENPPFLALGDVKFPWQIYLEKTYEQKN